MAQAKTGTIVAVVITFALIGIAAFFIVKGIKAKKGEKKSDNTGGNDNADNMPIPPKLDIDLSLFDPIKSSTLKVSGMGIAPHFSYVLKVGSRGIKVTELQKMLLEINPNSFPIADGIFGAKTEEALFNAIGKKAVTSQADLFQLSHMIGQKKLSVINN